MIPVSDARTRRLPVVVTALASASAVMFALVPALPASASESTSLAPVADSYADSIAPAAKTFGDRTSLRLNGRKYTRIPYLSFDLAGVPSDATDVTATLTVTPTEARDFEVSVQPTGDFAESTLAWSNRPALGPVLDTAPLPKPGVPLTLDVSLAAATAIQNGTPLNLGLTAQGRIQGSTYFRSSEAASSKPRLDVSWTSSHLSSASTGGEHPVLVGASAGARGVPGRMSNAEEFAWLERKVGRLEIRHVYDPAFSSTFSKGMDDVGKRATHYSMRPDMSALAAGKLDARVRGFLDSIPSGHRTILTLWHEPEVVFTTSTEKATYRKAWQRFGTLVENTGRPELSTSLVLMSWTFEALANRNPDDWWPGAAAVDIIGVDTYNGASLAQDGWDSPLVHLGKPATDEPPTFKGYTPDGGFLAYVRAKGKDWGVAEFGSLENVKNFKVAWTNTATKGAWVTRAVDDFVAEGAVYVEYFHSGPYRGPWWLDSSASSLSAFKQALAKY